MVSTGMGPCTFVLATKGWAAAMGDAVKIYQL